MAYSVEAQNRADISSLCAKIDDAIANSQQYVAQREANIAMERRNLKMAHDTQQKFNNSFRLYELYRPFVSDSAIYFLKECVNIGMYDEALCVLDSLKPTPGMDSLALGTYYEAYNNVYSELSYYTRLPDMKENYLAKAHHYEQLMLNYLPADNDACLMRRELALLNAQRLDESMKVNDEWKATVEEGSHPYAFMALYRYLEFKARRDTTQMMYWLVESVQADIKNAVMDQGSMWELANELMLQGDIDRASRYISYTSDCANRFGSRQRNWQIIGLIRHLLQIVLLKVTKNRVSAPLHNCVTPSLPSVCWHCSYWELCSGCVVETSNWRQHGMR